MDATETDDESVVGEAAHIVAEKDDGPRGNSPLTRAERDKYANLILLCAVHHKQVDDQVGEFTVVRLHEMKDEHEKWVRQQLDFDELKLRDDVLYAGYVEDWCSTVRIDEWDKWASWMLSADQPKIRKDMKESLDNVRPWILSRVWPGRYPELEAAFTNFRFVAQDLCLVFEEHAENRHGDSWQTAKFYKITEWDDERYHRLLKDYEQHVALVEDLLLELTRAANYVCDKVRQALLPSFRIKEGVLLVTSGPYMDLRYRTHRVEYRGGEKIPVPYRGLEKFMSDRFSRDYSFAAPPPESALES